MRNRLYTLSFCLMLLFLAKAAVIWGLCVIPATNYAKNVTLVHHNGNDEAEKNADEKLSGAEEYIHVAVINAAFPPANNSAVTKIAIRNTCLHQQAFLSVPELPPDSYLL